MLKEPRKLEMLESGWMIPETIFEPKTFQLQGRSATQQTVMFGYRVLRQVLE